MIHTFRGYLPWVVCGVLVILGPSLGKARKVSPFKATMMQTSASPLVFKTKTAGNKACLQSCLTIEASMTNTSSESIAIDTVGLRYAIEFRRYTSLPNGGSVQVMTKRGDYGPGQYNESTYQILKTGETYSTTLNLPLTERFFRVKGTYKIKFTYGQFRQYAFQSIRLFKGTVESNGSEFKIVRCSFKKAKASSSRCPAKN